jgi:hypothetical protein
MWWLRKNIAELSGEEKRWYRASGIAPLPFYNFLSLL